MTKEKFNEFVTRCKQTRCDMCCQVDTCKIIDDGLINVTFSDNDYYSTLSDEQKERIDRL